MLKLNENDAGIEEVCRAVERLLEGRPEPSGLSLSVEALDTVDFVAATSFPEDHACACDPTTGAVFVNLPVFALRPETEQQAALSHEIAHIVFSKNRTPEMQRLAASFSECIVADWQVCNWGLLDGIRLVQARFGTAYADALGSFDDLDRFRAEMGRWYQGWLAKKLLGR